MCMRQGMKEVLPRLAMELAGQEDKIRARQIIRQAWHETATASFAAMQSTQEIPPWMMAALTADITANVTVTHADIDRLAAVIREYLTAAVDSIISNTPKLPEPAGREPQMTTNQQAKS